MTTMKRRVADVLERATGARVVRPGQVGSLFEEEFLRRFLEEFEVDLVLDVGANAGQYAQRLRERVGYTGLIVSCEPIPELAQQLRSTSAADPRWHVEECALSNQPGTATFNVMEADQFSSLHDPSEQQPATTTAGNRVTRTVDVTLRTVDDLLATYAQAHRCERVFVKMDTQGHDSQVVEGIEETLEIVVGLQSELAVRQLYADSPRFTESLAYYESRGFVLSALFPNNGGHFPEMLEMDCVMHRPAS